MFSPKKEWRSQIHVEEKAQSCGALAKLLVAFKKNCWAMPEPVLFVASAHFCHRAIKCTILVLVEEYASGN